MKPRSLASPVARLCIIMIVMSMSHIALSQATAPALPDTSKMNYNEISAKMGLYVYPTKKQSQQKLQKLLTAGKNKRYYADTEGAIRYVVADNGEKGLTFAVEPIKLALSDTLGGAN